MATRVPKWVWWLAGIGALVASCLCLSSFAVYWVFDNADSVVFGMLPDGGYPPEPERPTMPVLVARARDAGFQFATGPMDLWWNWGSSFPEDALVPPSAEQLRLEGEAREVLARLGAVSEALGGGALRSGLDEEVLSLNADGGAWFFFPSANHGGQGSRACLTFAGSALRLVSVARVRARSGWSTAEAAVEDGGVCFDSLALAADVLDGPQPDELNHALVATRELMVDVQLEGLQVGRGQLEIFLGPGIDGGPGRLLRRRVEVR